jgi:hypothetical protein
MTGVLRSRLVVFFQVSAPVSCWAVRWLVICDEAFARILHACEPGLRIHQFAGLQPSAGG